MVLTTRDKIELVKPLVIRFMLPLFAVYVEEYVINSVSQHAVDDVARLTAGSRADAGVSCTDVWALV